MRTDRISGPVSGELSPRCPGYPRLLRQIDLMPDPLFHSGLVAAGDPPTVAIVGSRKPTRYGTWMAARLARGLVEFGVTVVSGLARGIDTAAHRATLESGGQTIAVLGCGLDVDYPRGSGPLKEAIASTGTLFSEFPLSTPPLPGNFPRRNRIISGLSLAVVVVEAAARSGSLITARWALDQGRDVLAVPGRADSPLSEGPLSLIRDGAYPVVAAGDVADVLGLERREDGKDRHERPHTILDQIRSRPMGLEEIADRTGRDVQAVMAELTRLELAGRVRKEPGGFYSPL